MFWSYCFLCIVLQWSHYTRTPSCPACVLCSTVLGLRLALTISASSFLFRLYITTDSWVVVPAVTFRAQEMWRRCQLDCITELWSWRTDLGWETGHETEESHAGSWGHQQSCSLPSCHVTLNNVCVCVGWGACVWVCWHMCLCCVTACVCVSKIYFGLLEEF